MATIAEFNKNELQVINDTLKQHYCSLLFYRVEHKYTELT